MLLAVSVSVMAQTAAEVRTVRTIPFPDGSGSIAVFTSKKLPLTEPPLPMVRLGLIVKNAQGKAIATLESEDATGYLVSDLILVHGKPTILFGVRMVDGPGSHLYALQIAGSTVTKSDWSGTTVDYENTAAGDLKIITRNSRYGRDQDIPRVFIWDGLENQVDLESEKALASRMVKDADDELRGFCIQAGTDNKCDHSQFGPLTDACMIMLKAEVLLGDPARALQFCSTARSKVEACPCSTATEYVRRDTLSAFDALMVFAMGFEEYRKAAGKSR